MGYYALPLWWRRFEVCREMGWTVAEYDATPLVRLHEVEAAIQTQRRHAAAAAAAEDGAE